MAPRGTLSGALSSANLARSTPQTLNVVNRAALKRWKDAILERVHNDWDEAIEGELSYGLALDRKANFLQGLRWFVQAMLRKDITKEDEFPPVGLVREWIWSTSNAPRDDAVGVVEAYQAAAAERERRKQLDEAQREDHEAHWKRVTGVTEHSLDKGHCAQYSERTAQRYGLDKRRWEADWARRLARRA
ncbi:hypothetical protein JCM9279_000573 [Rhodotorula babjevae]